MNARITRTTAFALALALAACGGGGSSSSGSSIPTAPNNSSGTSAPMAQITFVIPNSNTTSASVHRVRPTFISSATLGVRVVATNTVDSDALGTFGNLSSGSSLCTGTGSGRVCTVNAAAFYGQTTFTITTYNAAPTGNSVPAGAEVLGVGQVSANIVKGVAATGLTVVLAGEVGSVTGATSASTTFVSAPAGTPNQQIGLIVSAADAGGVSLNGSGNYANPITVSLAETGGSGDTVLVLDGAAQATSVTSVTLKSSSDTVGIEYNGGGSQGYYATVSFSAAGATASAPVQMSPLYVSASSNSGAAANISGLQLQLAGTTSSALVGAYEANVPAGVTETYSATLSGCTGIATSATATVTPPALADYTVTGGNTPSASGCTITVSDGFITSTMFAVTNTFGGGGVTVPGGSITDFAAGVNGPLGITAGPDGTLWFGSNSSNYLGNITTSGSTASYQITTTPAVTSFSALTVGPDGAIWASGFNNTVARIEPNNTNNQNSFSTGAFLSYGITSNVDGNLYLAGTNGTDAAVDALTVTGASSLAGATTDAGYNLEGVAHDANGDLFGCSHPSAVWVFEAGALATPVKTAIDFACVAIAQDNSSSGNIWFTENAADTGVIGEMSTSGALIKQIALPGNTIPAGITAGPDAAMWFVDEFNNRIGRIPLTATSAAQISYTTIPTGSSGASDITLGPDGNLWFTETGQNKIGKLVP